MGGERKRRMREENEGKTREGKIRDMGRKGRKRMGGEGKEEKEKERGPGKSR